MAALLDRYRDYTNHRRIMLSGDLPGAGGQTIRDRMTGDTGELGLVFGAGYYYNSTYNSMIASDTANTQFIHGAFNYSATSGTGRGAYLITYFSGAGAVSGECIRARAVVSGASSGAVAIHGIHSELRITTGGSVSGDMAAVRATLASDIAIPSGSACALRLESSFAAAFAGTVGAFIALYDVNSSYKMPHFLDLTGVASGTAAQVNAVITDGSKAASGFTYALRVKLPSGAAGYIPIGTAFS